MVRDMQTKESRAFFTRTPPLAPLPQHNSVDKVGVGASFAAGFTFVSLFLPWMNYALLSACSIASCPPPIAGQASIPGFISGIGVSLPANIQATSTSGIALLNHAAGILMVGAWILLVCFVFIAIALFLFIRNAGSEEKVATARKRAGSVCLVTSVIGLLTTSWIAFNITTMDQPESIHTTLGIGLWTTALGLGILTTIMVISAVQFRKMA
jgi:hypothetical protein